MPPTGLTPTPRRVFALLCCALFLPLLSARPALAYVIGPTLPGKWGGHDHGTPGGLVTWSLMGSGPRIEEYTPGGNILSTSSIPLSVFMPDGFLIEIEAAFDAWSAVADIDFMLVADDDTQDFDAPGSSGHIRIGGHVSVPGLAHGYFPPDNGDSAAGDIHFDSGVLWSLYDDPDPDVFNIFRVASHEIGHAIGLHHQPDTITALMNRAYSDDIPLGLLQDDIAGAQFIYGPRVSAMTVTEPGTPLLLGIGLLSLLFRRYRKRARSWSLEWRDGQ